LNSRDARPVFLSRRKAHELPASTYYLNIARYCSEKLKQYNFYAEHYELHSRLKSLKFEELAVIPEIEARKIYDYLKWEIPANLHSWIGNNTRENSGLLYKFLLLKTFERRKLWNIEKLNGKNIRMEAENWRRR